VNSWNAARMRRHRTSVTTGVRWQPADAGKSKLSQQLAWTSFVKPNEVNGQFHSHHRSRAARQG
jgi:hypothetical protein